MNEQIRNFTRKARENHRITDVISNRTIFFSNIWTSLIAPFAIGWSISYYFGLAGNPASNVFWVFVVVFIIVHFFTSLFLYYNSKKYSLFSEETELVDELQETRNELAKYKHGFEKMSEFYVTQLSALHLSAYALDNAIGDLEKFKRELDTDQAIPPNEFWESVREHLKSLIQPLIQERERLFGYTSENLYNIALYIFDEKSDSLFLVHRDCDSRIPRKDRTWKPGHGHIGLAFLHKEAKICPDVRLSNELTKFSESDSKHYRSFISIPILRCTDDGSVDNQLQPLGVIVLTSAHADQFDQGRDLGFLTTLAKLLAIYLSNMDAFLAQNPQYFEKTEKS